MVDLNKNKISFNFLKSLEIVNINNKNEFWEDDEIRNNLVEFLVGQSKNPIVYAKVTQKAQCQDEATAALKSDKSCENEQIEVGFVDGLFEM